MHEIQLLWPTGPATVFYCIDMSVCAPRHPINFQRPWGEHCPGCHSWQLSWMEYEASSTALHVHAMYKASCCLRSLTVRHHCHAHNHFPQNRPSVHLPAGSAQTPKLDGSQARPPAVLSVLLLASLSALLLRLLVRTLHTAKPSAPKPCTPSASTAAAPAAPAGCRPCMA